jgi:hypothetical protein
MNKCVWVLMVLNYQAQQTNTEAHRTIKCMQYNVLLIMFNERKHTAELYSWLTLLLLPYKDNDQARALAMRHEHSIEWICTL